jgi:hypothetical protein
LGWIKPTGAALFRSLLVVVVVVLVWAAAGAYYRESFREQMTDIIQYRIKTECLRPNWVTSRFSAREYDVAAGEFELLTVKLEDLQQRAVRLGEAAAKVEALRNQALGAPKGTPQVMYGPGGQNGVGGPVRKLKLRDGGL